MTAAKKHPHEEKRIESLRMLNILDTLPEKDFDDIVLIASQICETPIALISLVDSERQWFKAKIGLEASETSRDVAFCSHAILQDDLFIIPDATTDERFSNNPFVKRGPNMRFYAGAPLISPDGLPIGTVCVIDSKPRTLSLEQHKALSALSNQVSRLLQLKSELIKSDAIQKRLEIKKTALDNISEGTILYNDRGMILDFNPAALEMFGLTPEVLLEKRNLPPHWKFFSEDGSPLTPDQRPSIACLKTGSAKLNAVIGIEFDPNLTKWFKVNSIPLFLDGATTPSHVVSSFNDITEIRKLEDDRRRLQVHLSESAKLSTLGEMSSGIAHEINNPLAIIHSWNQHLMRKLTKQGLDPVTDLKHFESIDKTCERIAKIIRSLRAYSHNAEKDPMSPVIFSQIIDETLGLCQERFRQRGIEIKVQCNPGIILNCRSAQISQVFISLLTNSYDAIINLQEKWIEIDVTESNDNIVIKFTDSGAGINPDIVKKMMTPFFTTKEPGHGTGLGLSISRDIIISNGGEIQYDPNSPHTSFLLTFKKQ